MKLKIKILICLLIISGSEIFSSEINNPFVLKAFDFIYNQQYDSAAIWIQKNRNNIDSLYSDILTIDLNYWKCVTVNTKEEDILFEKFLEEINPEQVISNNDILKRMVVLIYGLRFHFKRHHYAKFNITWIKMKLMLNEVGKIPESNLKDAKKLMNMYYSIYEYFEGKYNPLHIFKRKSILERSLHKIEQGCRVDQHIVRILSHYFVGKIYLQIEKDPEKAKEHFVFLNAQYPGNKTFVDLISQCN